jgi:predicted RecA/RadA family phage recombinase
MTNKLRDGKFLAYTNPGTTTITAGTPVAVGVLVGVAVTDIASGATGTLDLDGVFALPKETGAWTQGAQLYFNTSGKFDNATSTGAITAGVADAATTTAATTGYVRLKGGR